MVSAIIVAAGKGTRMKSRKAKVLHKVGGAALLEHVLKASQPLASRVLVVVGHQAEKVKALLPTVAFVDQTEQCERQKQSSNHARRFAATIAATQENF